MRFEFTFITWQLENVTIKYLLLGTHYNFLCDLVFPCLLRPFLAVTASQTSLVFYGMDSFEGRHTVDCLSVDLFDDFLKPRLWVLGWELTEVKGYSLHIIQGFILPT